MSNQTFNHDLIIRLFSGTVKGCLIGIVGGIIFGAISSCFDWAIIQIFYEKLHIVHIELKSYITGSVVFIFLPLGLLIGTISGLHHAVFRISNLKSSMWAVIACLSSVLALWLSGFSNFQAEFILQVASYVEIAFFCFMTSWIAYKYTIPDPNDESRNVEQKVVMISSLSGLFLIFIATYYYFAFQVFIMSIRT